MSKKENNNTVPTNWSVPMNTLIEKISQATGAIFEPYQKVRLARAEVEASKILNSLDDFDEVQTRAIKRMIEKETRKQINLEKILKKASKKLSEKSKPENVDNEWLNLFTNKCENVSNEVMQEHWSLILSSEVNNPGTFSKKTLEIMSSLERNDAEFFSRLCQYIITFVPNENEEFPSAYILEREDSFFQDKISYWEIKHLESLGLISYSNSEVVTNLIKFKNKSITLKYGTKSLHITPRLFRSKQVVTGNIFLTNAGMELSTIVEKDFNEDFYRYIKRTLKNKFKIIEVL